jgi:hypothetical protein
MLRRGVNRWHHVTPFVYFSFVEFQSGPTKAVEGHRFICIFEVIMCNGKVKVVPVLNYLRTTP